MYSKSFLERYPYKDTVNVTGSIPTYNPKRSSIQITDKNRSNLIEIKEAMINEHINHNRQLILKVKNLENQLAKFNDLSVPKQPIRANIGIKTDNSLKNDNENIILLNNSNQNSEDGIMFNDSLKNNDIKFNQQIKLQVLTILANLLGKSF